MGINEYFSQALDFTRMVQKKIFGPLVRVVNKSCNLKHRKSTDTIGKIQMITDLSRLLVTIGLSNEHRGT
ncbi:hypothetical protein MUK42_34282 [Musa troglodytarum]|uniref:Uncharacterized protein n=1 Tax=Musa troglodytarum TaxID=320322 RepID=A0A9E7FEK3_9LILI|nr:hypothetical protein MUK42_34282 [Musa troglodytarum]